jgi:hypothetical protein
MFAASFAGGHVEDKLGQIAMRIIGFGILGESLNPLLALEHFAVETRAGAGGGFRIRQRDASRPELLRQANQGLVVGPSGHGHEAEPPLEFAPQLEGRRPDRAGGAQERRADAHPNTRSSR